MIRVVLDTNIIVSALLQPQGPPAQILMMALRGTIQLCMTGPVYAEYEEVIRRPRFKQPEAIIVAAMRSIRECALWLRPAEIIECSPDPDDSIFLACAQAASADFLVTGNLRHFPTAWGSTRILGPREFLEHVTKGG